MIGARISYNVKIEILELSSSGKKPMFCVLSSHLVTTAFDLALRCVRVSSKVAKKKIITWRIGKQLLLTCYKFKEKVRRIFYWKKNYHIWS